MSLPASTPPEKTLQRVLLISAIDGWSLIGIAAIGTLLALALGDLSGAFVGLMAVVAGTIELRGRSRLVRRDAAGMRLLVRAQMFLLAVLLVYCASRLGSFDEGLVQDMVQENLTPEMEAALLESGIQRADVVPAVKVMFYLIYGTVAFVSLLCQGGLALYYRSRTPRVTEALATPPQSPLA
jgi:hypothetical protein